MTAYSSILFFMSSSWEKWWESRPVLSAWYLKVFFSSFLFKPISSLPLAGKPMDKLWNQVLLSQLPSHSSLFCSIDFSLYFFSVFGACLRLVWTGASPIWERKIQGVIRTGEYWIIPGLCHHSWGDWYFCHVANEDILPIMIRSLPSCQKNLVNGEQYRSVEPVMSFRFGGTALIMRAPFENCLHVAI